MNRTPDLSHALWNRSRADLRSDETLAQLLEWGTLGEWRAIFRLLASDPVLRERALRLVERVPLTYGGFWLAALSALGEPVAWPPRWPEEPGV